MSANLGTVAGPVKILLVEDNRADVRLVRMALHEANLACEIEVAGDGDEAFAYLQQEGKYAGRPKPDLVLLDLNLPRRDGRQVLRMIRETAALSDLAVVILSSSPKDVLKGEPLRVDAFFTKPPTLDEYLALGAEIRLVWEQHAQSRI